MSPYFTLVQSYFLYFCFETVYLPSEINGIDQVALRFKGKQAGWSPQGLYKMETQFTDLTETDASCY
jgi:hypothetical protein